MARQAGVRLDQEAEAEPARLADLALGQVVAEALGLDLNLVRQVFAQTGANSRVLETDGDYPGALRSIADPPLYLFVRGMTGASTPLVDGSPCGVFAWRPPPGLGISRLLINW